MLSRFKLDPFLLLLIATLGFATLLPARGEAAIWFDRLTDAGIILLFFLHGAKLSRSAVIAGLGAWQLHLMVLATTFILFPLIGIGITSALGSWLNPAIVGGFLFLCIVPSTVQSSIAMTAMAHGNVPAAVCSASLSNVLGIVLTPVLAAFLLNGGSADSSFFLDALIKIGSTLLLPFLAGHLMRPLLGGFVDRHKMLVGRTDRSVILLVVYTAFSAAVVEGLWSRFALSDLVVILLLDGFLLGTVLIFTCMLARLTHQKHEDEAVLVFCGSKKSLASGVPIAGALFPPAQVGLMVLPLMLFHQMQLIVCAALAQAYARRFAASEETERETVNA
ncbi:bile acid:sodium symporter [Altericroceibacterium spongiae]|uniref:Bile acid:sodium symporter n=1 Tax=Altericroceibacterium spongiae TaxID=2320269 RepID=A0A420ER59_9SPHN|nr:bile acid:sodium symporter family protein [Altericroceibacterium spongiae]RKF23140.1 bile acid:sodium symporter [Altericroceibacterium spongiae]